MIGIGIDVGGTFTDVVAVDEAGGVTLAKAPSTPADQSVGVLDALARLAERLGLGREELLRRTERIVHGTTVATNALLERKGAKVGLLTTDGHRDVLEMREGLKPGRYDLRLPRVEPLVPRRLRIPVLERIRPDGRIETPLEPDTLERATEKLAEERVDAVAIAFLHAWCDGRHERMAREAVEARLPGVHVSLSSEVFPQIKEFERVSTTVVNAYVGPALARYLGRLEERLEDAGYEGAVLVMLSHGGVAPVAEAVRLAAGTVLSGPAGGVAAARHVARLEETPDLIPFDMGGTSTDISLVVRGEPALSADRGIAGERIALPALDIVSIGAGGGSIARVDAGGILRVGPESAGAVPGPACYGQGGEAPTVTDASLVLGYLDAAAFAGGSRPLDVEAARRVVRPIADRLGLGVEQAAEGIHRVIDSTMAEGIRLVAVRGGVDPRRFALLSFGGAAGIHATSVARQLEIRRVIVPRVASVLSAWGMLASDLRFEVSRTHIGEAAGLDAAGVRSLYVDMEREGRERLARFFDGPVDVRHSADMRYGEQIFEIEVSLDGLDWHADDLMDRIRARFHRRHEELYTYALPDQDVVLVNARIAAIGRLPALPEEPRLSAHGEAVPMAHRRVWLAGAPAEVPVFELEALAPGQRIAGPALLESETTTVLLRPGDTSTATARGWLDITVGR